MRHLLSATASPIYVSASFEEPPITNQEGEERERENEEGNGSDVSSKKYFIEKSRMLKVTKLCALGRWIQVTVYCVSYFGIVFGQASSASPAFVRIEVYNRYLIEVSLWEKL